jgi:hypothetical protein
MAATPSKEPADIDRGLKALVTTDRALALLIPPTNRTLTAVACPAFCLSLRSLPCSIVCQPPPHVPSVRTDPLCRHAAGDRRADARQPADRGAGGHHHHSRCDQLWAKREALGVRWGRKPSYRELLLRALVPALKWHPLLGARLQGDEIVPPAEYKVGVALKDGLIVPVVRKADELTLPETGDRLNDLAQRALENSLDADEVTNGTINRTNLGMFWHRRLHAYRQSAGSEHPGSGPARAGVRAAQGSSHDPGQDDAEPDGEPPPCRRCTRRSVFAGVGPVPLASGPAGGPSKGIGDGRHAGCDDYGRGGSSAPIPFLPVLFVRLRS